MDETTTLMHKQMSDFTLADHMKVNAAALAIMAGGIATLVCVSAVSKKVVNKVREAKKNRATTKSPILIEE